MDIILCSDSFKIVEDLHIDDWKHNKSWNYVKSMCITYFGAFVSNVNVALKIKNFEDVSLTKVIYFVWYRAWMHNINDIWSRSKQEIFISSTQL